MIMMIDLSITKEINDEIESLFNKNILEGYSLESIHAYKDEDGKDIYYRPRLINPSKPKIIKPIYRSKAGQLIFGNPPQFNYTQKPLYNLHLLKKYPEAQVYVVEGEKVADQMNMFFLNNGMEQKFVAVTSGGSTSAGKADWGSLQNRKCLLWGDNDESGRMYVKDVKAKLVEKDCDINIIDVENLNLPEHGDFVDWLEQNPDARIEDILSIQLLNLDLNECVGLSQRLVAVTLDELLNKELKPKGYIISPWLPIGGLCMIHAYRGIGKTHVALELAVAIANGSTFLSFHAPEPKRVLFLDGEMPANVMQERLKIIMARTILNPLMIQPLIITPDFQSQFMPNLSTPQGQRMVHEYTNECDVVIVDNISTLCSFGKENEADSWLPIQEWALRLRKLGKSVLFIHHSGKSGSQRGTSKREDILDTVICLKHPSDYDAQMGACFELHYEKARSIIGEDAVSIRCQLNSKG